jgi:phage I-like protein
MPDAGGGGGTFLFTERSAREVMARYKEAGVDMMIDLNHEAVEGSATRADSKDARGWFKIEVRGGELWATDVTWSPDGARRLAEKTQRYISPAFGVDTETSEIIDLVNCALVAMPATHGAQALVAASRRAKMSAAEVQRIASGVLACLRASNTRARLGVKR